MNPVKNVVFVLPILLLLGGCGSSTSGTPLPQPTATPSDVAAGGSSLQIRIINGSPGTGAVDVYVYLAGSVRPTAPAFANVPFGTITPYLREAAGIFAVDFLRAGALATSPAILSFSFLNNTFGPAINSMNRSLVISGTSLNGSRAIQYFLEPILPAGESALVMHHASPAANVITAMGPIGIAAYSTTTYPPGTAFTAIPARATKQLFTLTFAQSPSEVPVANTPTEFGEIYFLTPFPAAPLPATIGFAIGLPSTSGASNAPLASVIANAALSETANENSPYLNQNAISNDSTETVHTGTHISEFVIDADQNGDVGLIGTIDP